MPEIARSASAMIGGMTPALRPGAFVFASFADADADEALLTAAVASFREQEGLSLILPFEAAEARGVAVDQPMRCITLNVYSALDGVGLTAAVAGALAERGIACNMVAAFHHDHAFVPARDAQDAMAVLRDLQESKAQG